MKLLWEAISDKLRADATLVSLTGYTETNQSIARAQPPAQVKKPSVFFMETDTQTPVNWDTNEVDKTWVNFFCYGATAVECADIVEAMRNLFKDTNPSDAYLDISNSDVYCLFSRIVEIGRVEKFDKLDYWECRVRVLFTWSLS